MDETVGKLPDGFPAGMRVLAVDDSYVALRRLELLLLKCGYKVLSVDADVKRVMKGLRHGAVDYLAKSVRIEELKLIWTHVARRSLGEKKDPDGSKKLAHAARSEDVSCPQLTKKCNDRRKQRDDENSFNFYEDMDAPKKSKVTWTSELHANFINAVYQMGIKKAYPKKILDIMNVPDLTRENVSSHLKKYRRGLKKNAMGSSQQLFSTAGISAYNGSSLSTTINKQGPGFNSLDRSSSNVNKNTYAVSSYLPAQQSCNGNAHVSSSAWFPHPLSHQNNFCQQYKTIPQVSQLGTQHPGLTANSYMVKSSTQVLGYQSIAPRSNKLECYAQSSLNPWISDGDSGSNSVYQLTYTPKYHTAGMFLSNN